jgi:hypothetical protein
MGEGEMHSVGLYWGFYISAIVALCCEWREADRMDRLSIGSLIAALVLSPCAGWLAWYTR